ncbi:hypothetical protein V500_09408 [Pseudogymnoascus sp. VKM F-4518 (FW-2643)]|nr:hypothetical protein V500_09408 [Pseudogymnoascus sp. VKM F-4518 (FW-2643)]
MHPKGIIKEIAPWTRYTNIISMIDKAHIFDPPARNQGAFYCKPSVYLAIAFHDSGRSMTQIASDIEKLVGFSSNRVNRPTEQASLIVGEDISSGFRLACLGSFANIVAEQARRYLKSFPGNDASGSNPQHGWFRLIAGEETTDRDHLEVLFDELCYRNALTRAATICKDLLQLPIEDARLFDTWAWQQEQESNERWDRFLKIRHAIHDASVFGHPEPYQGYFFAKPTEYLAIAFVKSGRPMEQVLAEIKKIRILQTMAGYKRSRCETEGPEDVGPSHGSVEAKKPKTENGETKSPKRKRPPRTVAEEQKLNRLDQKEYDKIVSSLAIRDVVNREFHARRKFWEKFYARSKADNCPEDQAEMLNSRGRDIVEDRRRSCPWFVWGLDGYTRQQFPEEWTCFYEDGEKEDIYLGIPVIFPWDETQDTSAGSSEVKVIMDKTGSFALPLSDLEKLIEGNEKEISGATSLRDKKRAESDAMRKKATEFQTKSDKFNQKIIEFKAKVADSSKKATEFNKEADKLDVDVARSDETLKQIQPLLEVQKLILAARKANDSFSKLNYNKRPASPVARPYLIIFTAGIALINKPWRNKQQSKKQTPTPTAQSFKASKMEPQPEPPKRKRPESKDSFEQKVANMSLEDFPTPPGVNSFGEVDGQESGQPRDAAPAGPPQEVQPTKKRAPINAYERNELYKMDLAFFQSLYTYKSYDEEGWPEHLFWCRRKFWERYYRTDPTTNYPESLETDENLMAALRQEYAKNHPPWWFPGFPAIEKSRARYPRAWQHYKNAIPEPPPPPKNGVEALINRMDIARWKLMTDEQIEEQVEESEDYCSANREKILESKKVIEEYRQAVRDMETNCKIWQERVDFHASGELRAAAYLKERQAEEAAALEKAPQRKRSRTN